MFWNRSYNKLEARIETLEKEIAKVRLEINEMDSHIAIFADKVKKMRKLAMEAITDDVAQDNDQEVDMGEVAKMFGGQLPIELQDMQNRLTRGQS